MFKKTLLISAAMFGVLISVPAAAQDNTRNFDQGSIWVVTTVETKPGKFNAYINDLNNVWRRYLETQKKDGLVSSFKMIQVAFPRDGEPNLVLMVEYPNWAAFDAGNAEYFEKLAGRLQGSVDSALTANINREELRTIRSNIVTREISFK